MFRTLHRIVIERLVVGAVQQFAQDRTQGFIDQRGFAHVGIAHYVYEAALEAFVTHIVARFCLCGFLFLACRVAPNDVCGTPRITGAKGGEYQLIAFF